MFWGLDVTTDLVTILVAGVAFLLVWPTSRPSVIFLLAPIIGKYGSGAESCLSVNLRKLGYLVDTYILGIHVTF
jgi:hypothetical protein